MAKGTRWMEAVGATDRTTISARPIERASVVMTSTRSAATSVALALAVTRPGSPGPTPTPTRAGREWSTGVSAGERAGAPSVTATSRSMAWRMSSASGRPVRAASSARARFSSSGR